MTSALNKFFQRFFGASEDGVSSLNHLESQIKNTSVSASEPDFEPVTGIDADLNSGIASNPVSGLTTAASVQKNHTSNQIASASLAVTGTMLAAIPEAESQVPAKIPLQIWRPVINIDAAFFDWLMGHPGEGSNFIVEQKVLKALFELLASDLNHAVLVPRMPSVIPQLLSSLRNKTVSTAELSRNILKDVALVGAVIKSANSAMYNPADRINSLDKAIMILGEDGLRLLIAKVAFNPIINLSSGHYTRRAASHIWAQSEKCAIAAHYMAEGSEINTFQAFLTGLMKNIGMIIAFRLLDQVCEEAKFKFSAGFHTAFSNAAATLSYRIAQRWEFPEYVVQALQQQAEARKSIEWTPLGHLLHSADLISKMRLLVNHAQLVSNDERLRIGLPANAATCFEQLNQLQLFDLTPSSIAAQQAKLKR